MSGGKVVLSADGFDRVTTSVKYGPDLIQTP